jgi:ADP-heptose:LPS heptosyltransferase
VKILIGKTFGIGNAICAIPMIKAIRSANPHAVIDLLVGTLSDDFGAEVIFSRLCQSLRIGLFRNVALGETYDVAVMSIPFDGRWVNGIHFKAEHVIDGRKRPDETTFGFSSWKKHEVLYQMENAEKLGWNRDKIPDCSFPYDSHVDKNQSDIFERRMIYVGTGFKRDRAGLWATKHWGNENYVSLIKMILEKFPDVHLVSSGNMTDLKTTMGPIALAVGDPRYTVHSKSLPASFTLMSRCDTFVGNDTGMAHVAASMDKDVNVIFKMPFASTKSSPWCKKSNAIDSVGKEITPSEVFTSVFERI